MNDNTSSHLDGFIEIYNYHHEAGFIRIYEITLAIIAIASNIVTCFTIYVIMKFGKNLAKYYRQVKNMVTIRNFEMHVPFLISLLCILRDFTLPKVNKLIS